LGMRVIDLMELLEDPRPLLLRDAGASVHHTDREVPVDSFGADADLTCISELDCIANEIEQHLRKTLLIADTNRQRLGHRGCECELLVLCERLSSDSHGFDHGLYRVFCHVQRELAG